MMKGVREMKARWEPRGKGERDAEREREPHTYSGGGETWEPAAARVCCGECSASRGASLIDL